MLPGRKPTSIGMLTYGDNEQAVAEIARICKTNGCGALIERPDRKLTVAVIDTEGKVQDLPG